MNGHAHGSTIMVTGGCGFIGSNFINHLLQETDARVVNYDCLSSGSNKAHVETSDRCTLVTGDIRNRELLEKTLDLYNVEEVVHFAACTHAGDSFEQPEEYIETNVQGTLSLLEAVRRHGGIKTFLYISTDEVYGESAAGDRPKKESDILKPTNPYAASKLSAEKLVEVYQIAHGLPARYVRMSNVYGPKQGYDKVIPKFISQARLGKPFTIEGDGRQLRTWLYVADACRAIHSVLLRGRVGEFYNIATTFELSILDLAKAVKEDVDISMGEYKQITS